MTELTAEQTKLREETIRIAIEYGFAYRQPEDPTYLKAPLGKFEGEPYYIIHYYDMMMNGMTDRSLYFGDDSVRMDLFEATPDEIAAFELKPDTTDIALEYTDTGFVKFVELTGPEAERLEREDELESGDYYDDEWDGGDEDEDDDGDIVDDDLGTIGDDFFDSFNDF